MGWQDDPIVDEEPQVSGGQSFMDDPIVDEEIEAQAAPPTATPSMGEVAMNAVPKGAANLLNTPITLGNLIMQGIEKIADVSGATGIRDAVQFMRQGGQMDRNVPMEMAESSGLVDPSKNPQTGPQRIVDMAIQSAIGSAATPVGGVANIAKTAAMGLTSGAAAQSTKEATGSDLLAAVVGMATPLAVKGGAEAVARGGKNILLNETAKMTLKDAQRHGFVVEPSQVRQPTSKIETVAGKAAIAQGAVEKNQGIANRLAARSIGLPDDTALSPALLKTLKDKTMQPYKDVDAIFSQMKQSGQLPYFPRYHSASLMDEYIEAGQEAKALWKSYNRTPDISVLKAAKAADAHTGSILKDIEMVATASGQPDLSQRVQAAKQLYARINDVEMALNVGSGNISLPTLAKLYDNGKPLTGELKTIAKFANAFPRSARQIESVPPSGVSGTDAAMAATLGLGGAAASGSPAGLAAAGLPLLRNPAKRYVLSEKYQQRLLSDPSFRFTLNLPKGSARGASIMTGKTVLDNTEASE